MSVCLDVGLLHRRLQVQLFLSITADFLSLNRHAEREITSNGLVNSFTMIMYEIYLLCCIQKILTEVKKIVLIVNQKNYFQTS